DGDRVPDIIRCAEQIKAHLNRVKNHIMCAGRFPSDIARLTEQLQTPEALTVRDFALATHGFGPLAVAAVIECLMQIIYYLQAIKLNEEEKESLLIPLSIPSQTIDLSGSFNDSGLGSSFNSTPSNSPVVNSRR
ncbi:hypothetical protein PFISCL1PPCAC_1645, partial [Pristionchus fissidentatus]